MDRINLTNQDVSEIKKMIMNAYAPGDIVDRFGCAISTVHYYKNKLKDDGKKVPDVKGKRPTGEFKDKKYVSPSAGYQSPSNKHADYKNASNPGGQGGSNHQINQGHTGNNNGGEEFKSFKINGNHYEVPIDTKSVKVLPDGSVEIIF